NREGRAALRRTSWLGRARLWIALPRTSFGEDRCRHDILRRRSAQDGPEIWRGVAAALSARGRAAQAPRARALRQGSHPPGATLGARPRRADNCALGRAATRTARADLGRLGLANRRGHHA